MAFSWSNLKWSNLKPTRRQAVYGGIAATAATGAYLGYQHGPGDLDPGERAKAGAVYGLAGAAALGGAGYLGYRYRSQLWSKVKGYKSHLDRRFAAESLRRGQGNLDNLHKAWRKAGTAGAGFDHSPEIAQAIDSAKGWSTRLSAYATLPVAMGAGAVLGAMVAGEDHRVKGAVIGAAAGAGALALARGVGMWKNFGRGTKYGLFAAGAALAFGAGSRAELASHVQAALVPSETGEAEYADPSAAQSYDQSSGRGPGRRSRNLQADGGVVLGSHRGRHG